MLCDGVMLMTMMTMSSFVDIIFGGAGSTPGTGII